MLDCAKTVSAFAIMNLSAPLTSVTLDPCLAEDGSVRNRVNSPELAPLPVNLES
jgi:hypothetical protein